MLVLTTEQMRRAEALTDKAGLSYLEMMLNAGLKAYEFINTQFYMADKSCVILCGSGNNGGDGFVVAKKLEEIGCDVAVVMCNGAVKDSPATEAFQLLQDTKVKIFDLKEDYEQVFSIIETAAVIIDAVFGIGFRGQLSDDIGTVLRCASKAVGHKIALDMPSGVSADTGICAANHFIADVTLVFGALKPANTGDDVKTYCGRIIVFDIGIPNDIYFIVKNEITLINAKLVASILPKRNQHTHKGNYGRFVNVSGSSGMCGAAIMSTLAGMRVGAGLTTLVSTSYVVSVCASQLMEATTYSLSANEQGGISADDVQYLLAPLQKATACLVGCGLMNSVDTKHIVEYIAGNTDCSVVFDADALNVISQDLTILNKLNVPAVITPHIKEMSRLTSLTVEQVQKNTMETAKVFAREHNVVVVLKTNRTIIASPTGEIYQNTTGNAGLAKGGSGDVLSGMIAGFLAQGMEAVDACICGVYLLGAGADILDKTMSQYTMLARDIIQAIPQALKAIDR